MKTCIYKRNYSDTDTVECEREVEYGQLLIGDKDSYMLGSVIGSGAEGCVYEVQNMPEFAVKVFHKKRIWKPIDKKKLEDKIKFMISHRMDISYDHNGIYVTWPLDTVYLNDKFVGYVMPRVHGGHKLCEITDLLKSNTGNPPFTWRDLVVISQRLANAVSKIHSYGYVIGDMNPENILVDMAGIVTITDTDSFEFNDSESHKYYPCLGGTPGMLPPELQKCNNADFTLSFDKESDNFALAVNIFMLLMNGNHPYDYIDANGNSYIADHIADCEYYFGAFVPKGVRFPEHTQDYRILPGYMQGLFKKAFSVISEGHKTRPTADEWVNACNKLWHEKYKVCHANKKHVFRTEYGKCPWCDGMSMFDHNVLAIAKRIDDFLYDLRGDSVYGDYEWAFGGRNKDKNINFFG